MKWELKNYDDDYLKFKSEEFHENELITRLLLNRSIISKKEVENFLNSGDESLHDPFLFEQMEEVVDRILQARNNKEKVIIYGDYDVDGISGTAYLVIILRKLGMNVDYYIPNRAHEGVGINKNFLKYLIKRNTRLIITVDTSISTSEEILMLKSNNIDIIITDHHRPVNNIAEFNLLTVNPKISKKYPNKNLSGSGVAFKLATAIYEKLGMSKKIIFEYIDLVMIGTVADVVPMIDENRYIIKTLIK